MNFNQIKYGRVAIFLNGVGGAISVGMLWGKKTLYNWGQTTIDLWGDTTPAILANSIATTHYNRVIADGGVLPAGISGLSTVLESVVLTYQANDSTDFNTKVPVFLDPHYTGYKLGAGSGTTLGQAARTVYAISSTADVTQTTAASQPLLLAHSGVNYWWGSGVSTGPSGNHCSTPNAVANQITGDIEIIVKVDYVNNSAVQMMVSKSASANWQYDFYIGSDNKLNLQYALNGVPNVAITKSSSVAISSAFNGWVKATRTVSNGDVKFFTSTDGINYTQLGTTQTGTSGNLNISTSIVYIGAYAASLSSSFNFQGKIYRATISNTIGGAPVVDFNPATYNAATSQTAWTSSTSEVWTINTGTAATGYKGQIVDRTYFQNDGIDDCLIAITSGSGIKTQYFTHKLLSGSGGMPFGLWIGATFAQAFYYPAVSGYGFYQQGPQDGPFGTNITTVKKLRVSGAVGGTGTDWIPFQNGVDVSNGGYNVGSVNSYTSIRIAVRGNDTGYDNGIVGNYIVTNQADTALQRTTIQNLLKTMSNL